MPLVLVLMTAVMQATVAAVKAPKTPPGLAACNQSFSPQAPLPRAIGENLRYQIAVSGVSVGTVDFQIARAGQFSGTPMVEYRSLFALDALAAAVLPVRGRAAALVPNTAHWPRRSMSHFTLGEQHIEETVTVSDAGDVLGIVLRKDSLHTSQQRSFPTAIVDFVSGFYLLRRAPRQQRSCVIVYGNQRAYTIWLQPRGRQDVKTPVGMRLADLYEVTFASERAKQLSHARVFLGVDTMRLPLVAQIDGERPLEARLHRYTSDASDTSTQPAAP